MFPAVLYRKGLLLGGPVDEACLLIQPGDCGCQVLVVVRCVFVLFFFFFFCFPPPYILATNLNPQEGDACVVLVRC